MKKIITPREWNNNRFLYRFALINDSFLDNIVNNCSFLIITNNTIKVNYFDPKTNIICDRFIVSKKEMLTGSYDSLSLFFIEIQNKYVNKILTLIHSIDAVNVGYAVKVGSISTIQYHFMISYSEININIEPHFEDLWRDADFTKIKKYDNNYEQNYEYYTKNFLQFVKDLREEKISKLRYGF